MNSMPATTPTSDVVIGSQGLTKSFGAEQVLRGIDLSVACGQVVGLLGTNGSGKTTLMKCLLGLLRRSSGTSQIFGEDSWNLSAPSKARLGYVSQDFALMPWMKVRAMCGYTGAFYASWDEDLVRKLLAEWKLPVNKTVSALSIGQRQKLAVILAMGHRPELLILDEPVASLDPIARRQFLQTLVEFSTRERNTILFSSHITSDLERIASHVALLAEGQLRYMGELDGLKENCKRLRILAEAPLPRDLQIPGMIRSEINGQQARVTVTEIQPGTISEIADRLSARVQVEDLNLEEIFLELNGSASEDRSPAGVAS
jgi:ABC-2 type transport system ATP-binding protein